VPVEDAAYGAVGAGDGPQHAPLFSERRAAPEFADRLGRRDREDAREREPPERIFGDRGTRVPFRCAGGDRGHDGLKGAFHSHDAFFVVET